jgi:hypothetical protein
VGRRAEAGNLKPELGARLRTRNLKPELGARAEARNLKPEFGEGSERSLRANAYDFTDTWVALLFLLE